MGKRSEIVPSALQSRAQKGFQDFIVKSGAGSYHPPIAIASLCIAAPG
jgi:hypothetical protein